ncbi:superfamily II DNA/RNA helicase [Friedmanniella endophytica]|uniref:Superfamily II DNA/RNA helicase n=1 Tax=Microlunatus kandeliicorticis TaxID=1759536 RepID=A0A7W3IPA8_9ACTN|nr:superfamily II DNA/RNA helicase [Microlunatus kandeliicorticis]
MPADLVRVLAERDITQPTPIQAATLADAIGGRDVLGRGRTGSGKTYAFLLPLVTRLAAGRDRRRPRQPRALILAPTRELVTQIDESLQPLAAATGLRTRTVFGGVGQGPQAQALAAGVDVLVACPGRLEDLIKQGLCRLDQVQVTVLDEADHMADLGFLPAVTRLLAQTAPTGQRLFFSATLDRGVDGLVKRFLRKPAVHHADSVEAPVTAMEHHVLQVSAADRIDVAVDLAAAPGRTVIFTRTKSRAKALTRQLNARGVPAVELHGNLGQSARTRNMEAFHSGRAETLVATDIAARGIHVDDVALVLHADPPAESKAYLHRSGRTARAGKAGTVVTLMTPDQIGDVRALTRAAGIRPTTTVLSGPSDPVLRTIAEGERRFQTVVAPVAEPVEAGRGRGTGGQRGRGRRPAGSAPRGTGSTTGSTTGSSKGSGQGRRRSRGRSGAAATPTAASSTGARTGSRSGGQAAARGAATTAARSHSASNFSRRVRSR